jgi:hypothetical protein
MANVFTNKKGQGTESGTTVYTAPSETIAILIGLNLANTTSSQVTASVTLDGSFIIKDAPIPSGSALSALDGKIIVEEGEVIEVFASVDNSVDAILSLLEQS